MDPTGTIDSLKSDPEFWKLDVPTQMEVARRKLDEVLPYDKDFASFDLPTQKLIKDRLVAEAATFSDPNFSQSILNKGQEYVNGASGAVADRTAYEIVQGFISGSGLLSYLRSGLMTSYGTPIGDDDIKRGLDYYKSLDSVVGGDSTAANVAGLVGQAAEAIGISLLMKKPTTGLINLGRTILSGAKAAEVAATAHPAIEMLGSIAADAITTAAPLYVTEEMRRAANGEQSVISQGADDVLKVLGENAAMNFVVGSIGVGVLTTIGKAAKTVFKLKDAGGVVKGDYASNSDLVDAFVATGDPVLLARMDPITRDAASQRRNILAYVNEGVVDPDKMPLAKAQWLAHNTGRVIAQTDNGTYRLWQIGKDKQSFATEYVNLNDVTNTVAYKTYKEWLNLDEAAKAKWPPNGLEWALKRGESLAKQENLLASNSGGIDPNLSAMGKEVQDVTKRSVVTKAEADYFSSSSGDYIAIQAKLPIDDTMLANARGGERNLFKGSDSVRVASSDEPNMVFIGTKPATDADYAQAVAKAQEAVGLDPSISLESSKASILLDKGFDYYKHADGTVEFFAPRNAKLIGEVDDIAKATKHFARTSGPVRDRIIIEAEAKASFDAKTFVGNSDAVIAATVKAIRNPNTDDLANVVKAYLEGHGVTQNIAIQKAETLNRVQLFRNADGSMLLRFPKVIETAGKERQYVGELFDHLKKLVKDSPSTKTGTYYANKLKGATTKFGFGNGFDVEPWANDVVSQLGGTFRKTADGLYEVALKSGTKTFNTLDDVTDFLAKHTADPTLVKKDLLLQGYNLSKTKDGWVARKTGTKEAIFASSIDDIMDKVGYVPSYIDKRFGPKEVRINDDGTMSLNFTVTQSTRSLEEAMQTLAKFKDTNLLARQKLLKSSEVGELSVDDAVNYRVYLSKYDHVQNFDNLADARKFLEQEVPKWSELQEIARKKRLDLSKDLGDRYKVVEGNKTYYAASDEELQSIFKRYPDIEESVPDLMDALDATISRDVAGVVNAQRLGQLKRSALNKFNLPPEHLIDAKAKDVSMWMATRQLTSQKLQWFRDATQRANRPNLMKLIYRVQDARRLAERDSYLGSQLAGKIFEGSNGKTLSIETRQKIFYHLGQADDEAKQALEAQYKAKFGKNLEPLTNEEQIVADRLSSFYDKLFFKSGLDARKYIYKYQPMLRDASYSAEFLNSNPNAEALAQHVFGDNVPKEVRFWAEHERSGDIFAFAVKDDPLELLLQYNSQMHKKLYMNPVWQDIVKYIELDKDNLGGPFIHQLNVWREQLMGYYRSPGEKVVEDIGTALMTGLKKDPRTGAALKGVSQDALNSYGRNMLRNALSLTYLVQMGFRPWVAIRNTLQPFTTLSMRFGVTWTLKAYDDVAKAGSTYFEHLRFLGILSDHPPIVDEIAGATTKIGKLTKSGLQWIKNSDDLTRAVAYRAAELRFDNAIEIFKINKDLNQFKHLSGLSISEPIKAKEIESILATGDVQSAKDAFGAMVTRDTMFPNDASESSLMRSGLVGKLFGQYGSYSEAYRANLFNILKYGSFSDRAKMVATYLAICGAMTGAFNAINVRTTDYMPLMPAVFTGGPNFYAALNFIQAGDVGLESMFSEPSNMDKVKLAEAKQSMQGLLPGGYQLRYLNKAKEYFDAGDDYRAFLAMTGIPSIDD